MDSLIMWFNRCECGMSRFWFCHYCGDSIIMNIVIFLFVFGWIVLSLFTLFKD